MGAEEGGVTRRYGVSIEPPDPVPGPGEVMAGFAEPPGLYVHVPFCRSICPFCPFDKVRYRPGPAAQYAADLSWEAARYLSECPGPFPSLYVGGGTPTLCLDQLEGLLERLPVSGERAIEVLPDHMTAAGASRLAGLGFDFVSLGVQSFEGAVLRRLGRPGTPERNRAAVEQAVGRFACVDVDLIFDTAYDRPGVLLADLETCFGLGVDQVSTYPLMRFGYTPFGPAPHRRRREHALLSEAAGLAAAHGYRRRSVWTFNREGSATYSSITRPAYLGMGAGASTFTGTRFAVNHFGLRQYGEAIAAGRLPIARLARLPAWAAAAYRGFWQAYTGWIPGAGDRRHPVERASVAAGRAAGWLRRDGAGWALTPSGYDRFHDLEQWVTYRLIEPLWAEMMAEHDLPGEPAIR